MRKNSVHNPHKQSEAATSAADCKCWCSRKFSIEEIAPASIK